MPSPDDEESLLAFVQGFSDEGIPCRPQDGLCFFTALSACREAEATFAMRQLAYRYEILGTEEERCRIRMSFPLNPNPEWIGEPMTCSFPEGVSLRDLQVAHEGLLEDNPYQCEGPLVDRILSE